MQPENNMTTPEDMKRFSADDYDDPFQIVSRYTAGYVLLGMVVLAVILAPVLR